MIGEAYAANLRGGIMLVVDFWDLGCRRMMGWEVLRGQRVIAGWVNLKLERAGTFALLTVIRLRPGTASALRGPLPLATAAALGPGGGPEEEVEDDRRGFADRPRAVLVRTNGEMALAEVLAMSSTLWSMRELRRMIWR